MIAEVEPDVIMHLAAETPRRSFHRRRRRLHRHQRGGNLRAAGGGARLLAQTRRRTGAGASASTTSPPTRCSARSAPTGRFDEDSPYRPNSPYAASKAASDHLVRAWHSTYGLPVVITNCGNNFGPYQFPEKLIPLTILNALEGRELPVYGRGENVRDWLYVEDHVRALMLVAERGRAGETYAIGGGDGERTNLEVVEAICDCLDRLAPDAAIGPRRDLIRFVADRPGHDLRYAIDSSKIRKELGWTPAAFFRRGARARPCAGTSPTATGGDRLRADVYGGERLGLVT